MLAGCDQQVVDSIRPRGAGMWPCPLHEALLMVEGQHVAEGLRQGFGPRQEVLVTLAAAGEGVREVYKADCDRSGLGAVGGACRAQAYRHG